MVVAAGNVEITVTPKEQAPGVLQPATAEKDKLANVLSRYLVVAEHVAAAFTDDEQVCIRTRNGNCHHHRNQDRKEDVAFPDTCDSHQATKPVF
jgi:hypothetical protein